MTAFLYADGARGIPDPSVKGLPLEERQEVVSQALIEMRSAGAKKWSSRMLAGFARRIRDERRRPASNSVVHRPTYYDPPEAEADPLAGSHYEGASP